MKTLILNLTGVTGHARRVLSHNIQRNLLKMGFQSWPSPNDGPKFLDCQAIWVNNTACGQNTMLQDVGTTGVRVFQADNLKTYDALTQSEEFLRAAFNERVTTTYIAGVKCTITPQNVDLDATEILNEVMKAAKQQQTREFGSFSLGSE